MKVIFSLSPVISRTKGEAAFVNQAGTSKGLAPLKHAENFGAIL